MMSEVKKIIDDYLIKTKKIFPNTNINTKHINTILHQNIY